MLTKQIENCECTELNKRGSFPTQIANAYVLMFRFAWAFSVIAETEYSHQRQLKTKRHNHKRKESTHFDFLTRIHSSPRVCVCSLMWIEYEWTGNVFYYKYSLINRLISILIHNLNLLKKQLYIECWALYEISPEYVSIMWHRQQQNGLFVCLSHLKVRWFILYCDHITLLPQQMTY